MHIKKFTAKTVQEALKAVKDEFGNDAVILSTKKVKNSFNSFFVEIAAAVDYDLKAALSRVERMEQSHLAGYTSAGRVAGHDRDFQEELNTAVKETVPMPDHDLKKELASIRHGITELKTLYSSISNVGSNAGARQGGKRTFAYEQPLVPIYQKLASSGVDERLIDMFMQRICDDVKKGLSPKDALHNSIKNCIKTINPLKDDSGPKILTFIGPTGVGKTTTIAKIAANHAVLGRGRVTMLTLDTYRIAASEQLKTYGRIMGVNVEVIHNAKELKQSVNKHINDVILIDTAGRSQRDKKCIEELKGFLAIDAPMHTHLVLSIANKDETIYEALKTFGSIPVDSLIFTKLDETSSYGTMLNVAVAAKKPVAYLTIGQRVPEDIWLATSDKIARMICK
ncbi:MAG: flagellar biosynthesis protein FlhF [Deltaproteobacteria bacterium]|nr:flagellar biosynthesis protein FlhF [Deltaproteobacteria bacterium]